EITLATAGKESKILISEGYRQEAINISEGEKQKRINEALGRAREIEILAEASAEGLRKVAQAIIKPGGGMAVKMRLVEDYINRTGEVLKGANVSVLPTDLAHIKGLLTALRQTL